VHRIHAIVLLLLASVAGADDRGFARGDLVLDTIPSPGLNPWMKVYTIALTDEGATSFRTLALFPLVNPPQRLLVPAFDKRCSLKGIRSDSSGYEVVDIRANGDIQRDFAIVLPSTPTRLFIDARDIHYVSILAFPGVLLPYDLVLFDSAGKRLAEIDLPDANGIGGFDVTADGCAVVYPTESGRIARFDLCGGGAIQTIVRLPFGRASDVRLLPSGEVAVLSAGNVDVFDAGGSPKATRRPSYFGASLRGLAVAPDGHSVWTATSSLYRLPLDQQRAPIVDGVWIPGAISVGTITVCGDWRLPPRRRAAR
jgi:hypothetical protein